MDRKALRHIDARLVEFAMKPQIGECGHIHWWVESVPTKPQCSRCAPDPEIWDCQCIICEIGTPQGQRKKEKLHALGIPVL